MMMSNQRTRSLFILLCLAYCLASVSCYRSATTTAGGKDYYGMMGLSKDCSATDIKKAYRRLALKHHPDKVAAEEREQSEKKFKEIARAYEILSDDDKRQLYDQYGEAGIDPNFNPAFSSGNGMSGGPQQTFNFGGGGPSFGGGAGGGNGFESMFSGFGNSNGGMKIDLNEILRGFMEGQAAGGGAGGGGYGPSPMGGFGGTRRSSTGSGGGPGMNFFSGASSAPPHQQQQQQQQQQYYSAAKEYTLPFSCTLEELATGCTKKLKVTHPTAAMDPMTGQPMIRERIYSVKVKPGWKKGTKIKFKATQDGFPPIAFTLNEKKHNHYRRINNDIIWKCVLSPNQAAKGVKLKVPLLTGNILELVVADNDEIPIQHQQRKIIKGKGMPIKGGPQHGDLIIEFYIKVKSG